MYKAFKQQGWRIRRDEKSVELAECLMRSWEDQTEAELMVVMSRAPTVNLQYLHYWNMGKVGAYDQPEKLPSSQLSWSNYRAETYIHPLTELIEEELRRRGEEVYDGELFEI